MSKISRRKFFFDSIFQLGSLLFLPGMFSKSMRASISGQDEERDVYPSFLRLYKQGTLAERAQKLFAIYENCTLCPRDCRVNRTKNEIGKCQATSRVKISGAHPHFGEEKVLVGSHGSGTIFFSNCGLRCIYCQNYTISIQGEGTEISDDSLAQLMIKIQKLGCHNINLVTPTHYVPNIVNALQKAIPLGLRIPLVYNTGGYEKLETLQLLDGIIDIYLPDCKYTDPKMAAKYSSEAFNYPYYAKIGLKEMFRQVGDLELGRGGIARRGLIVRHLVLPNRIAGTEDFLKFVSENLSKTTYLNIMRQYRPEYKAFEYPELSRRIKASDYAEALAWAKNYGLTRLDR